MGGIRPLHWLACLLVFWTVSDAPVRAQVVDTSTAFPRVGVSAGWQVNYHSAGFQQFGPDFGINYASTFESGNGGGVLADIFYRIPISQATALQFRGGYAVGDARLTTSEQTTVILEDRDTTVGEFERRIAARLGTVNFEGDFLIYLPARFSLHAGGRVGIPVSNSYEQSDVLVRPEGVGVFENFRRIRSESSGEIGEVRPQISVVAGVSRDLPLDRGHRWILTPELVGTYAMTPLLSGVDWSAHSLRFSLSVSRNLVPAPPPPPPPAPEPPPPPPVLAASISAVGILDDGTVASDPTIRIEEFISTNMRPLLNYVFFDVGSAALPTRYHALGQDQVASFDVAQLHDAGTMEVYYDILNIVGRRLQGTPSARLEIAGTNSGTGVEAGNLAVARARAETVRDYLVSVWGIAPARLSISARGLPQVPSDTSQPDGIAENRRVELTSNVPSILSAVITDDTLRQVTPRLIRFLPQVNSESGIALWSVSASRSGVVLIGDSGAAEPRRVEWTLAGDIDRLAAGVTPVSYRLQVRDVRGTSREIDGKPVPITLITLEEKQRQAAGDVRVDRYGLILFEYDRADLNPANQSIAAMIRARIGPHSSVSVKAYTDRIGESGHNQRLSEERAANTALILGIDASRARGYGESVELFDNDLPEGRFYNRTVEVVVETPLK